MTHAGQPSVLKWYNSQLIHRTIVEHTTITKPELAQITHLSLPTVHKIVDMLVRDGLIVENDAPVENKVGRRAKTYAVDRKNVNMLIVYYLNGEWIGSTVDLLGGPLYRSQCKAMQKGQADLDVLCDLLDDLMAHGANIRAIGVGIPGVVMKDGLVTGIPSIPSFDGLNLPSILDVRYHMPVYVENDVKLMTLGYYTRKMDDLDNIVFLYIGSGIGAGVIVNGQLYKGNASFAGELGYMSAEEGTHEEHHSQDGGSMEHKLFALRQALMEKPEDADARQAFCLQLSKMLVGCATVINPEAVVLYCDALCNADLEMLYANLERYLPTHAIPQIRLTLNRRYGEIGLCHMCQEGVLAKCWLLDAVETKS